MNKTTFIAAIAAFLMTMPFAASAQFRGELTPEQKLHYAEALIMNFYVEDVNADSLVEEGIRGMLSALDPHSAYSTPQETEDLNTPLEGRFSGIGVTFNMSTDTVYVISTIQGGPSEKVGIRPGDRIISADDSIIAGKKLPNSAIMSILRGPKDTQVTLGVKRGNSPDLIYFLVTRDDIPMNSVDAAYMVTPEIGFISLSRFAETSTQEISDALRKLKAQGMRKLILDLESNGGGYLSAAVGIASLFLEQGDPVVYTEGKNTPPNYYNVETAEPEFKGDIAVMVDQYSASASEILSGALQDNDRAVIVGRRTFGKGLVQRPFPFPDGSMIRLTVSRYYTPTGRSIQKHYEKGKGEEYALDLLSRYDSGELWSADSMHYDRSTPYYTLKEHRPVYGGGGIIPDVFVPVDTTYNSSYYRDLIAKNVVAPYAIHIVDAQREQLRALYPTEEEFVAGFVVDQPMIDRLAELGAEAGVERNDEQLQRSLPLIEAVLKGLILRDLYEDGTYVRATNHLNPVFLKALEVLEQPAD